MTQTSRATYIRSLCLASALILTAAFASPSVQAQATQYDVNGTAAQLGSGAVTTTPYSSGDSQLSLASPYQIGLGTTTVTFTATAGNKFETFTNFADTSTGALTLDYADGTRLLDTFDAEAPNPNPISGIDGTPTGPLRIDFSTGVSSFGLSVQSGFPDFEAFAFQTFSGTTPLTATPLVTGIYDNTGGGNPSGKSLFLGAESSGLLITSVVVSSTSLMAGPNPGEFVPTGHSNDFFFGPVTAAPAAVPEASTVASLSLLMLCLSGAILRRKMTAAKALAQ